MTPIQAQDLNGTDDATAESQAPIGTYTDLSNMVNDTPNGSTLNLSDSYCYNSTQDELLVDGVVISKNLTVVGKNNTYIDGNGLARGFFIDSNCSVILENLTFKNGFSQNNGGGIYLSSNSTLTLINCRFIDNSVYNSNGGAIYAHMATNVLINNSYFFNNTSIRESDLEWEEFKRGMGSVICQSIDSNMTLIDSVFKSNRAYLSTVLLVSYTSDIYKISTLFIKNCLFENNTSFSSGVVYLDELGRGEITGSVFRANNITDHSGVLVLDASVSALIRDCLFDSNSAINGGAMHIKLFNGSQANVSIADCNFSNNRVSQQGGVIYSNSGIVDITNSSFTNNSCAGNGGAILAKSGSINITDSRFVNNSAEYGGALSLTADYLYMSNVSFISNTAKLKGGAVYSKTERINVSNCTYENNAAPACSDIYGAFYANVSVSSSYFDDMVLTIKLDSPWQMPLNESIKVKFTGSKTYTAGPFRTDSNGTLTLKVPLSINVGKYSLSITMDSGVCFVSSTINVVKAPCKVTVSKLTTTYRSGKVFKIYVKNSKTGKPVKSAKLKLKVWTGKKYKTYTLTSDKNGLVKFYTSKLSVGTHKVEITSANGNIKLSKVTTYIKVKKAKGKISYSKTVKKPSRLKVTIKNRASGNPIKKNKVTVKVYTGKQIKVFKIKTNSKGVIKVKTSKLSKGRHKVSVSLKNSCYDIYKKFYVKIK